MTDFFQMGGYAAYVWSAYGLTAAALVFLAVSSLKANRDARMQVERLRPRRRRKEAGDKG